MELIQINDCLFEELLKQAVASERLRSNFDLRGSVADGSQRMLNALMPGTSVPIHRHQNTPETVVCLMGEVEEVLYNVFYEYMLDEAGNTMRHRRLREIGRHRLSPLSTTNSGSCGIQIPAGLWHTLQALKPSVIIEFKDGPYEPQSPENLIL